MISVITPVYNGTIYIEECIKNVISQRCPQIQHIIIDGQSTDGTIEIIRHYASQYPHIDWISEQDQGQSDAMNKGLSMAKGSIVSFLNADDYYEPDTLNKVLKTFENLPEPTLLVGNCNVWEDNGNLKVLNKPCRLQFEELLLGHCVSPLPMNPSAYFYHRSLHSKIGCFKVDETYTMDLDFIFRAVQTANTIYVNETFGNFRLVQGSKTADDQVAKSSAKRVEAVLSHYRKMLPLRKRWHISLRAFVYREATEPWWKVKYFLLHPEDIFPSVEKRLLKR